jgi:hypothetical protein
LDIRREFREILDHPATDFVEWSISFAKIFHYDNAPACADGGTPIQGRGEALPGAKLVKLHPIALRKFDENAALGLSVLVGVVRGHIMGNEQEFRAVWVKSADVFQSS